MERKPSIDPVIFYDKLVVQEKCIDNLKGNRLNILTPKPFPPSPPIDNFFLDKVKSYLSGNVIFPFHEPGRMSLLKYHVLYSLIHSFKDTATGNTIVHFNDKTDSLLDYISGSERKIVFVAHNKSDLNVLLPSLLDILRYFELSCFVYIQSKCLRSGLKNWQKAIKSADVVIITILGLLEVLRHGFFSIRNISCIVLDDITNATKSHPYCVFMKEFILPLKSLILSSIYTKNTSTDPNFLLTPQEVLNRLDEGVVYNNFPQIVCFIEDIKIDRLRIENPHTQDALLDRQKIIQKIEHFEHIFQCDVLLFNEELENFLNRNNSSIFEFPGINGINRTNVNFFSDFHQIKHSGNEELSSVDNNFLIHASNLYRVYNLFYPSGALVSSSDYRGTLSFLEIFDTFGALIKKKKSRFETILTKYGTSAAHCYFTKLEQQRGYTDAVVAAKSFELSSYGPYYEENPYYEMFLRSLFDQQRNIFKHHPKISSKLSYLIKHFSNIFFPCRSDGDILSVVFVVDKFSIFSIQNIIKTASARLSNDNISIIGVVSEGQWNNTLLTEAFFLRFHTSKNNNRSKDVSSFKKEFCKDPRLLQKFMKERPVLAINSHKHVIAPVSFTSTSHPTEHAKKCILILPLSLYSSIVTFLNSAKEFSIPLVVDFHLLDVPYELNILICLYSLPAIDDSKASVQLRKIEFYLEENPSTGRLSTECDALYSQLSQIQFLKIAQSFSSMDKLSIKTHPHYRLISWVEPLILSQTIEYTTDADVSHHSFIVPTTGAYLSILSAPELLSKICSYLQDLKSTKKPQSVQIPKKFYLDKDSQALEEVTLLGCSNFYSSMNSSFKKPAPQEIRSQLGFQILKANKSTAKDADLFVCKLFLPNLFPVPFVNFNNQAILGEQYPCKSTARSSASFYAVKALYEQGVLDSHLLPSAEFLNAIQLEKEKLEKSQNNNRQKISEDSNCDTSLLSCKLTRVYYPIKLSSLDKPFYFERIWKIPKVLTAVSWDEKRIFKSQLPLTFYLYVMNFEDQNQMDEPLKMAPGFSFFASAEKRPNRVFLHEFNVFDSSEFSNSFGILLTHDISNSFPAFEIFLSANTSSKLKIRGPYTISLNASQLRSVIYFQIALFKIFKGFKNTLLFSSNLSTEKEVDEYIKEYLSSFKYNSPSKQCFIEDPILKVSPHLKCIYLVVPVSKSPLKERNDVYGVSPELLYGSFLHYLQLPETFRLPENSAWEVDWSILRACSEFFPISSQPTSLLSFINELKAFYSSCKHNSDLQSSSFFTHHHLDDPRNVENSMQNFIEFSLRKIICHQPKSDIGYRIKNFRPDLNPSAKAFSNHLDISKSQLTVLEYAKLKYSFVTSELSQPLVECIKIESPSAVNFLSSSNFILTEDSKASLKGDFDPALITNSSTYSSTSLSKISEQATLVLGKAIIDVSKDNTVINSTDEHTYSLTSELTLEKCAISDPETYTSTHSLLIPESLNVYPLLTGHFLLAHIFPTWMHQFQRFLLILELYEHDGIINSIPLKPSLALFIQALTSSSKSVGNKENHTEDSSSSSFDYERMELLGDSILKYCVSLDLFISSAVSEHDNDDNSDISTPLPSESDLTRRRSKLISNANLFALGISFFSLHEYANIVGFGTPKAFFVPHIVHFFEELLENDSIFSCNVPIRPIFDECLSWIELSHLCDNSKKKDFSPTSETFLDALSIDELKTFYNEGTLRQLGTKYSNKVIPDMLEALIGAYYISTGLPNTLHFLQKLGLIQSYTKDITQEEISKFINHNFGNNSLPIGYLLFEKSEGRVFDKMTYINRSFSSKVLSSLIYLFDAQDGFRCAFSDTLEKIEKSLGYAFNDPRLALLALVHPSISSVCNFERLEFLGDSVLDFVVTKFFYDKYDNLSPNELTELRSASVNNEAFARMLCLLELDGVVLVSPETQTVLDNSRAYVQYLHKSDSIFIADFKAFINGTEEEPVYIDTIGTNVLSAPKLLGDIFESLAGAIFLDLSCQMDAFWTVYQKIISFYLDRNSAYKQIGLNPVKDLMENVLKLGVLPNELVYEFQNEHSQMIVMHRCTIKLRGKVLASVLATGRSCAKRIASSKALEFIIQGGYKEVLFS